MRKRPRGPQYTHLHYRRGVIYYERRIGTRRIKLSTKTADWDEAAAFRALYEQRKGIGTAVSFLDVPRFAPFAERYLREAAGHLSASTREDRDRMLGEGGLLTGYFGERSLDEITKPALLEWWLCEIEGKGRHERTGLTYLSALSSVFGYAEELELIGENPVDAFRANLRRRRRSKRGRAQKEQAQDHRCPIEDPSELARFVAASRATWESQKPRTVDRWAARREHVADLLMLDAGLRSGEAAGLRWRDVEERHLHIRESLSRGKHEGPPKSGRSRRVELSRRLRLLLLEWKAASGNPRPLERVLPRFVPRNHAQRHFEKVCIEAKLSKRHTPKCLRDTFASSLLTAGIPAAYIITQTGHATTGVLEEHYAKWCSAEYRRPLELTEDEVPADVIARTAEERHHSATSEANGHHS